MAKKRAGRPKLYNANSRIGQHMAALVRRHGLTGAQSILAAEEDSPESELRKCDRLQISLPTLRRIAAERGVELRRGRRSGRVSQKDVASV